MYCDINNRFIRISTSNKRNITRMYLEENFNKNKRITTYLRNTKNILITGESAIQQLHKIYNKKELIYKKIDTFYYIDLKIDKPKADYNNKALYFIENIDSVLHKDEPILRYITSNNIVLATASFIDSDWQLVELDKMEKRGLFDSIVKKFHLNKPF
jgi:hypothetical protein